MNKKIPVIGYWHILSINHYFDIISEQLKIMLDSGLYEAVENIFVGVLGENEELKKIQALFVDYPKIIIAEYSTDREKFEFQTLKILKDHADKSKAIYYGFYIHTKAVSWAKPKDGDPITISKSGISSDQAYNGGKYLVDYMNYFTLKEWKDNIFELDKGYETCGTQLRPKREFPMHYSGNMWWFNSGYIKILKKVEHLNRKDRFQAEWYSCSGNPIAATLCQHFADYNTKGKFSDLFQNEDTMVIPEPTGKAPEETNGRNVVHTLCWNLYDTIEEAVRQLYEMNDKKDFFHVLVDLSFPLQKGDEIPDNIKLAIKQNSEKLQALAYKYGSKYVMMENQGVSKNWSIIAREENITDDDVLISCDSDERINPECGGWVKAAGDAIRGSKNLGVVSLTMMDHFKALNKNNSQDTVSNGVNVIEVKGNLMWPQIGVSGRLINEMGGIPYPKGFELYGGLESAMLRYMEKNEWKWGLLPDYICVHPEWDFNDYLRMWKHYVLENHKDGQVTFEKFLEMKKEGTI